MRIMIKKSVADKICRYWGFPLVKSVKTRRQEFLEIKQELLAHIRKLREQEEADVKKASWELEKSFALEKATGKPREKAENGTIRTWGNGKKYKRIAPGKWVQVFNDDRTRGAKQSLRYIEKKIASINDERELMWFVQQNKEKFVDDWGYPLPAVERLSQLAHKRNDEIVAGKEEAEPKSTLRTVINNVFYGNATKEDRIALSNAQQAVEKKIEELEKDPEKKEELNSAWEDYYDITPFSSLLRRTAYTTKNAIERSKILFDLRQDMCEQGRMKRFIKNVQFDEQLKELFDSYTSTERGAKARHEKAFNELCKKLSSAYYINIQNSRTEEWLKKTVGDQAVTNVKKIKAVYAKRALNAPDTGTVGKLESYRSFNQHIIDGCYDATYDVLNKLKEHCKGRKRTELEDKDIKKIAKQLNSQFDHKALFEMLLHDRPDLIIKANKTFSNKEKEAAKEKAVEMVNDLYMIRRKSRKARKNAESMVAELNDTQKSLRSLRVIRKSVARAILRQE